MGPFSNASTPEWQDRSFGEGEGLQTSKKRNSVNEKASDGGRGEILLRRSREVWGVLFVLTVCQHICLEIKSQAKT